MAVPGGISAREGLEGDAQGGGAASAWSGLVGKVGIGLRLCSMLSEVVPKLVDSRIL